MAETAKEYRIATVAKELNVGLGHIIEHLNNAGFKIENRPTVKITQEMYDLLLHDFSSDRADKLKAEKLTIGLRPPVKADEKETAPPRAKEEENFEVLVKNLGAKNAEKKAPEKERPAETEKPAVKEKIAEAEKPVEKEIVAEEKTPITEPEEKEVIKPKVEKLAGTKIVGNVTLETKSEEKKGKKKKDKKEEVEAKSEIVEAVKNEAPTEPVAPAETEPQTDEKIQGTESDDDNFRKTAYGTLSGPKVVGKVDLTKINDKPANYSDIIKQPEKRKRKRIYSTENAKAEEVKKQSQDKDKKPNDNNRPIVPARQNQGADRRRTNDNRPGDRRDNRDRGQVTEISEKQIQEKIKETLSRLGHATKAKGSKSKYRRLKREEAAEEAENAVTSEKVLQATEFISVSELANLMNVQVIDVIKTCMNLGVMVSINQRLDAELIELVASEFGFEVQFISLEDQAEIEEDDEQEFEDTEKRAPIVTIMGHVDHGKTSLLDYIRESKVVAGEVGGITQHIGAYEVELDNKRKITFLDTPGHEAFTAMRARGAKVTDMAVIVIAADDSIMPQTREAISHAQAAQVPMIFAFNKMDKPGANAEKIREQLAQMNLLVEEWGGKFQSQEISAKTGANVQTLLDKILIEADMLELKANSNRPAMGSVIEASLDKGRGYVSTILVQNGTLHQGDILVAGQHFGRIKAMFNERNQRLQEAGPSTPVLVLGLESAPQAGEKFRVIDDEQEAKQIANKRAQISREQGIRTKKHITLDEIGRRLALGNFKELSIIVKADFDGSVEALTDSLLKLSTPEIQINVVYKAVGQITESDVLLATASDAIVIGFNVRPSVNARRLAEKENIEIRLYSIIYNAIAEVKSAMEGLLEPKIEEKILGNAEVREVFRITKVGTVAGSYVTEGKISRAGRVRLIRDGIVIYTGEMLALKRFKDDVKEASAGMECGISIKNYNDIKLGDVIEVFEEVEVKRTL
jgi:translation initiation factor IF-2